MDSKTLNQNFVYFYLKIFVLVIFTIIILHNTAKLFEQVKSPYQTPWYSSSWTEAPISNAVLSFYPSNTYWKKNYIGTQNWRIKETQFQGKSFWTVLESHDIAETTK